LPPYREGQYLVVLLVLFSADVAMVLQLTAPSAIVAHNFLILFYVTFYSLSPFHPLAKYPGPIINKVSKLWITYCGVDLTTQEFIHKPTVFQPFSFGPANCPGKNLAMMEMCMLVCYMVQRLKLKAAEGAAKLDTWEEGIEDFFVMERPPMPLVVEVRDSRL
jgi:hypothetical protein